ncbi:MAG: helix-turn-helix transcriptional regulator [Pseudomonadota bacterium]
MAEEQLSALGEGWYSNASATFGDRVAGAREALGLNQADLARKLGVRAKTLRAWEDDMAEPRANKLQMLAGVLNVSLVWLLTGEGTGLDEPETAEISADMERILLDIRLLRAETTQITERLGILEKRLRRRRTEMV